MYTHFVLSWKTMVMEVLVFVAQLYSFWFYNHIDSFFSFFLVLLGTVKDMRTAGLKQRPYTFPMTVRSAYELCNCCIDSIHLPI